MTTPPRPAASNWERLIDRARSDQAPAIDSAALLRAVRQEPLGAAGWLPDFGAVFARGQTLLVCLLGAGAAAAVAWAQLWSLWQTLPWAQLLSGGDL
jgi:hypothetical protein